MFRVYLLILFFLLEGFKVNKNQRKRSLILQHSFAQKTHSFCELQLTQHQKNYIHKNVFSSLFSVHNTIRSSRHEKVCLMKLRFERRCYVLGPMIVEVSLKTQPHDVINVLYYKKYTSATQPKTCFYWYQKKHFHWTISRPARTAFSKHFEIKCLFIPINFHQKIFVPET